MTRTELDTTLETILCDQGLGIVGTYEGKPVMNPTGRKVVTNVKELMLKVIMAITPEKVDVFAKHEPAEDGGMTVEAGEGVDPETTGNQMTALAEYAEDVGYNRAIDDMQNKALALFGAPRE